MVRPDALAGVLGGSGAESRVLTADEHPATPVFLAASSWAARLAVVHAARRPALLSGLLLLGPGLLPTVNLTPVRRVRVVIGHLAGHLVGGDRTSA